jgi:nicotinamidase-related amidase
MASSIVTEQNSVVVVIDIQQRLLAVMPKDESNSLVQKTDILLQAANVLNVPVLITEQYPKGLGITVETLQSHVSATNQIEKTCFSCTDSDEFMSSLRSSHRRQVILTGMETHICVLQTALALLAQGFHVFIVEDAVCSRTQKNKDNALQRLRQAGVIITNTESVLFEWLSDAKHPGFRALSKLIV